MKKVFILLLISIALFSCKKKKKDDVDMTSSNSVSTDAKKKVVNNYAAIVFAVYQDSYTTMQTLQSDAQDFLANPTAAGYEKLKVDWLNARIPYEQGETFRFYYGPIDSDSIGDPLVNSWPVDGSYIDYYVDTNGDTIKTGIIYDASTYPTISQSVITNLNGVVTDEDITTGYHAIEYLLWGQNFHITGPGSRPYTEYIVGAGGTASNQARRGLYLKTAIDLLTSNLKSLMNQWDPNIAHNYRANFVTQNPDSALASIFTGMGIYAKSELAGQRITVAYEGGDPHEAHSCFSDNSTNDVILGQQGIYNVYIGRYVKVDGTVIDGSGIDDLMKIANSSMNDKIMADLNTANAASIDLPPLFDQAVLNHSAKLLTVINALKTEADQFVAAAKVLGITVSDN